MAVLPAAAAQMSPPVRSSEAREKMAADFNSRSEQTTAAPMTPMRLSFMIYMLHSRVLELRKPSAVSSSPSMCRKPETEESSMASATAVTSGEART